MSLELGQTNILPYRHRLLTRLLKTLGGSRTVWGFDQDKINYGDERDASKLDWYSYIAQNNDTGNKITFEVGYDGDGRINGVRQWEGPAQKSYFGKELVSDFFKRNFDRDATRYTIYDGRNDTNNPWNISVWFDSDIDGEFIPSEALGRLHSPAKITHNPDINVDAPTPLVSDEIKERELKNETSRRNKNLHMSMQESEIAKRGALFNDPDRGVALYTPKTKEEWDKFTYYMDPFLNDVAQIANTEDTDTRLAKLEALGLNYPAPFKYILDTIAYREERRKYHNEWPEDYRDLYYSIANELVDDFYSQRYHKG